MVRDTLGLVRTEFPHTMYCVAGTQVWLFYMSVGFLFGVCINYEALLVGRNRMKPEWNEKFWTKLKVRERMKEVRVEINERLQILYDDVKVCLEYEQK